MLTYSLDPRTTVLIGSITSGLMALVLTMLALHVDDADIWASTDSTLKFGWEIAKANLSDDKTPDIGVRQHLTFA